MKALIALFAAALCTSAIAGDDQYKDKDKTMKSSSEHFEALDKNKDKRLSKTEVQAEPSLSAEFAAVDKNSDGYLSEYEYTASLDMTSPGTKSPTTDESYR